MQLGGVSTRAYRLSYTAGAAGSLSCEMLRRRETQREALPEQAAHEEL
jgi:hypothetical protein